MALGLLTHTTGKIFECLGTNAVQINAVDNEYIYDLVACECGVDTARYFTVAINNDYIRVSNDDQKYDFTTVTFYFSGCRVAIAKEA